jgi:hypothetical protein
MKEVEEVKNQILFDKNKKYSFTAVKGVIDKTEYVKDFEKYGVFKVF